MVKERKTKEAKQTNKNNNNNFRRKRRRRNSSERINNRTSKQGETRRNDIRQNTKKYFSK